MKKQLDTLNKALLDFQTKFDKQEESYDRLSYLDYDRLSYIEYEGRYEITWYAGEYGIQSSSKDQVKNPKTSKFIDEDGTLDYYEYSLDWFIDVLIKNTDKVRALTFLNPKNVGYNGHANWDFTRLIESNTVFKNLEVFKVQLYEIGDHNYSYIGEVDSYKDQQVTQLLAKMPNVVSVEIPSTPSEDFFKLKFPHLAHLKIQAGMDSMYFIRNLANSPLIKQISLDFMDSRFDEIDDDLDDETKAQEEEIANSKNPEETKRKIYKERLMDFGYTKEESIVEIDKPNRAETVRLFQQAKNPKDDLKELLEDYDLTGRWLENGEYNWET